MELARSTSRGGLSVRSVFTFALAAIVAALLWVLFITPATHAADVAWNGESIMYDGHQYLPAGEAKAGESHNLPVTSKYYVYIETVDERSQLYKAHVIYFAPGADPPTETQSTYVVYDYKNRVFSNPSQSQTVNVKAEGSTGVYPTSCAVEGVGWIVCPVTVWLAQGMDLVFEILKGFIEVQPLNVNSTATNNPMQAAWNVARSIANVAFIIVFLIIIYSQLTSVGISNYGLKKLIPRLIIAAVLVNLSYYITAIAIDASNILGYSVQDIFIQLRENVFAIDGDTWSADLYSFESVSGVLLSGGTAGLAVGVGVGGALLATGGSLAGLGFLLLPTLLGLILAVLVVLLILAARQAIIILLVIVSPLAFVAYLLPNTEKLFEKWRGLFITMLVFFPAFSLVFGGSQLAGGLIIQNANSWNVVILGMIVQVAPLVITPLLLKLSGSLLGRIAGFVNDPRKGLVDRTRNWANDHVAYHKQNKLGSNIRPYDLMGRAGRRLNNSKRNLEERTKAATTEADNAYHGTPGYTQIHRRAYQADTAKETLDNTLKTHIQDEINANGSPLHIANLRLDASKETLTAANDTTTAQIQEYRSGRVAVTGELSEIVNSYRTSHEQVALAAMRSKSAKDVVDRDWSARFIREANLHVQAAGVGGQEAVKVALASAIATQDKGHGENVAAARSLADHFKLSVESRHKLAMGNAVDGTDSAGNTITFSNQDAFTKEVAIIDTIKAAPYTMGAEIIARSHEAGYEDFRGSIAEAMETANWEGKAAYYDGEARDAVRQGTATEAYLDRRAAEFLVNGKLSAEVLATNHKNTLARYIRVAEALRNGTITVADDKFAADQRDPITGVGDINAALQRVKANAHTAHTDVRIAPRIGDREDNLKEIDNTF